MKTTVSIALLLLLLSVTPAFALFCSSCGQNLPTEANFCTSCGRACRLVGETVYVPAPPPAVPVAPVPVLVTPVLVTPEPTPVRVVYAPSSFHRHEHHDRGILPLLLRQVFRVPVPTTVVVRRFPEPCHPPAPVIVHGRGHGGRQGPERAHGSRMESQPRRRR